MSEYRVQCASNSGPSGRFVNNHRRIENETRSETHAKTSCS